MSDFVFKLFIWNVILLCVFFLFIYQFFLLCCTVTPRILFDFLEGINVRFR